MCSAWPARRIAAAGAAKSGSRHPQRGVFYSGPHLAMRGDASRCHDWREADDGGRFMDSYGLPARDIKAAAE
jgi:hypothetical protein